MKYNKPALSPRQAVELLIARGLKVEDEKYAEIVLENISYSRLSSYFKPFYVPRSNQFLRNASFLNIVDLYEFDSRLREIMFYAIEAAEVSLRATLANYSAVNYRDVHVHLQPAYFDKKFNFADWKKAVDECVGKAKKLNDDVVVEFFENYPLSTDLPVYMVFELLSFGKLFELIKGLSFHDLKSVARLYGLESTLFVSWVHCIAYVRNLCAHHSRLWNRELPINPKINIKDSDWNNINNKRLFSVLLVLKRFVRLENERGRWTEELISHINQLPVKHRHAMGIPDDWENLLTSTTAVHE